MPYAFNGQLRSDLGFGSGAVVRERVVLTAAHVVFNDQTLSYVSEVNWFFQKHAGEFDPKPVAARGWYVLSGYASARTNDITAGLSPGQSSPESRQWDVAALYFTEPAARGGYGGYLTSDAATNEWLVSSRQKTLAGYPVDGASFNYAGLVAGKMHKVEPLNYAFTLQSNRVYTTPGFLSFPGNSGGPVCVLHSNNTYYPAGVYLGTIGGNLSVVRAIDSSVVNLINLAANMGDAGTNFTGGGVLTVIPSQSGGSGSIGYLQMRLGPPAAVAAGAGWRLAGDLNYSSNPNFTRPITRSGGFSLEFKPIPGWNLPSNQTVTVVLGQTTVLNLNYSAQPPMLRLDAGPALVISGASGTAYRIDHRPSFDPSQPWLPWRTNVLTNGSGVIDLFIPLGATQRFYRAVWMP